MKITLDLDAASLNVIREALLEYADRLSEDPRLDPERVILCRQMERTLLTTSLDVARKETGM